MIVPSMKSAIRWTLWMRLDEDGPMSVVKVVSRRWIPSACASCVVRSAGTAASDRSAVRSVREYAAAASASAAPCSSMSIPVRDGITRTTGPEVSNCAFVARFRHGSTNRRSALPARTASNVTT